MEQADAPAQEVIVSIPVTQVSEPFLIVRTVANRELYATLLLLIHFFKWERRALGEQEKQHVFAPFRVERECTADMDPLTDSATPTEAQAIPWACGLKFAHRDPEALAEWLSQVE